MVSNMDVYKQLIYMRIPENRITITGMPIRSNFWMRKNKQEMQKKIKRYFYHNVHGRWIRIRWV